MEGLRQHGREWKKIASMIPTRTVVQIRTHAQKFFQKQAKSEGRTLDAEHAMRTGVDNKKRLKVSAPRPSRHDQDNGDSYPSARDVSAAAGGITPRTVAAATILMAPRYQSEKAPPHTNQWMAQQSAKAAAVLDSQRTRRSPRLAPYNLPPTNWPSKMNDEKSVGNPPLFKATSQAISPERSDS